MRILEKQNVWDAALDRIRYVFDEFENVLVGVSGGKDSTVVFQLSLLIAREKGRLPLPVYFFDQEAEWSWTIDEIKKIMYHPDVRPMWFQIPIHLDNATSYDTKFLKCWDPAYESIWCHQKDPIGIKENRIGTDRFGKLFPFLLKHLFPGATKAATIAGIRCEESPSRFVGLTTFPTYKYVTWGAKMGVNKFTFYPIYDWSFSDVWHAIHKNQWSYNKLYDIYYRHGVTAQNMRVSNLHHETAVRALFLLQEFDPELHDKLCLRLPGVGTAGHLQAKNFYSKELPFMFRDWREYRDHLIEKLVIHDARWYRKLVKRAKWDVLLEEQPDDCERGAQIMVDSILCNDYTLTKVDNYELHFVGKYRYDRVDLFDWPESNAIEINDEPVVYDFLWKKLTTRQFSYVENGRRYHTRRRWRYWMGPDKIIHREPFPDSGNALEAAHDSRADS